MKHLLLLATLSLPLSATVIQFDDLPNGFNAPSIPVNYAGLTWDGFWNYWEPSGTSTQSAPNVAYFNAANNQGFNFSAPTQFNGAWFAGFTGLSSTVRFDLFLANTLVHSSSSLLLNSPTMQFLASGFAGNVDRVQINVTGELAGWVVDDITYGGAVPEPSTWAVGLGGLALVAWRSRPINK